VKKLLQTACKERSSNAGVGHRANNSSPHKNYHVMKYCTRPRTSNRFFGVIYEMECDFSQLDCQSICRFTANSCNRISGIQILDERFQISKHYLPFLKPMSYTSSGVLKTSFHCHIVLFSKFKLLFNHCTNFTTFYISGYKSLIYENIIYRQKHYTKQYNIKLTFKSGRQSRMWCISSLFKVLAR
jgi:hypothetical protein